MLLSIIIATKGRFEEVGFLLDSISGIDSDTLEVLVIDQNVTNGLADIIQKFRNKFVIKHIKIEPKGASYARNIGIQNATGEYVCFPDDDCKFFPTTIKTALGKIVNYDVVFGKCIDELGNDSVISFAEGESSLDYNNYNNRFVEATMFARRNIMYHFRYDESLGVGTFHGAEEAFDLVLRLLGSGKKILYSSEIIFYHPNKVLTYREEGEIRRVFSYRCGYAKLCIKHKLYFRLLWRIILVIGYLFILLLIGNKKRRYYSSELLGLLSGVVIK